MITQKLHSRLYTVEFLRIFFVIFIILGHIMERYPSIRSDVLSFFHTKEMHTSFGVEFFFIMGGFFLYRRIMKASDPFELIKKIYLRLIPALLFVFSLCVASGTRKIYGFPLILSLTTGLSIPGEVTGWGDWYVGVYFWCSLLLIGLFYRSQKQGFLWLAVISYLALSLKFNAPYEGFMKTYYTIIGNQFIRGIYSMGCGFVAAYLSDKIFISNKPGLRFFFTILEAYFLVLTFNYIARSSHNHFNFLEMEIIFGLFLICVDHSFGYITGFLNKISKITMISKYVYPIFLGHIPFILYLSKPSNLGLNEAFCAVIICVGAILAGVFEYHFIERKVVPWIGKHIKKS